MGFPICIQNQPSFIQELDYVLKILEINKNITFDRRQRDTGNVPVIGNGANPVLTVSENFIENYHGKKYALSDNIKKGNFILSENLAPDYISTAFYLINSIQEYNNLEPDELSRFKFKNSFQSQSDLYKENIVQQCLNRISEILKIPSRHQKTKFFLSHDIDSVNGSVLEDGFNVLKKGRIDLFLKLLLNVAMGRPDWLNIDKIMKIESEYDCYSTFFWIVNKGKINKKEKNADYKFQSPYIQKHFNNVKAQGFENGIHKSISEESFKQEVQKYGQMPLANRYHYLKFALPNGYDAIEGTGIMMDASLGFSEHWGFRNSYGLPFNPFNIDHRQPYSFVEVPLHIMDRTFFQRRMDLKESERKIFDFFEKNKENCVLSVLWHNNFFTEYKFKGYLSLYKKIIAYIKENDFGTITPPEIVTKYSMSWP